MSGDVEVSDSAASDLHNHENVEEPEAMVNVTKKSQARIAFAWLRTKLAQPWEETPFPGRRVDGI
jgi:hypothetical protein